MSKIDILVVPSVWEEAYGLVIDEGFFAGKIMIASDVGGISERIIDGKNGFLVDPGDAEALEEKLEEVILDYKKIAAKLKLKLDYTIEDEVRIIKDNYLKVSP